MKISLHRTFLIPFLVLMLSLAIMITWVLHRSGEAVTDAVAQQILESASFRIQVQVERHLSSAHVILNAITPEPVHSSDWQFQLPLAMPDELGEIEERLWIATGLFPQINNLAYFAAEDGSFVSVKRLLSDARVEVRYRRAGEKQSNVYSMSGPRKQIALLRSDQFEPRQRPWYKNALQYGQPYWSQVYIDFTRKEPLLTLSKPVTTQKNKQASQSASQSTSKQDAQVASAQLLGVVATDLSLKQLSVFLQSMKLPHDGVAFVVEKSDELIASSLSEIPYTRLSDATLKRQAASESASELMRSAARHVQKNMLQQLTLGSPLIQKINGETEQLQVAATSIQDAAGLDWIAVVVVPQASLGSETSGITTQSLFLSLGGIGLMLILGYATLRWTMRDIRKLTEVARSISSGEPFKGIDVHRSDEIGVLADSLLEMEKNLRIDTLTQLLNRETFISQVAFRYRRSSDIQEQKFAILFIDLDYFKVINDTYGHDAGDKVLIEVGKRLKATIRKDDAAARFGGDEFAVYLHNVQEISVVEKICQKLRAALECAVDLGGGRMGLVGASIGVAIYPGDGLDMDSLLRAADNNMFEEKKRRKAEAYAH
ncbi:hypothetical protein BH11PSE12_BH11PSE12_02960 [soil metagenome]